MEAADPFYEVVKALVAAAPRAGETLLQKGAFIAQDLLGFPVGLEFELYRHGPYSSGLIERAMRCEAEGKLRVRPKTTGNGYRFELISRRDSGPSHPDLQLLARKLSPMSLQQLEVFATAAWATKYPRDGLSVVDRAHHVHSLKPHIDVDRAIAATVYLDDFLKDAAKASLDGPLQTSDSRYRSQRTPSAEGAGFDAARSHNDGIWVDLLKVSSVHVDDLPVSIVNELKIGLSD